MEARIKASEKTELPAGLALDAAWQTAREDKVRTLGGSLTAGLLAEDGATIDTEQMIIAAIADILAPQLAMLDLLVAKCSVRYRAASADGSTGTSPTGSESSSRSQASVTRYPVLTGLTWCRQSA
jgi:hypothetical protein